MPKILKLKKSNSYVSKKLFDQTHMAIGRLYKSYHPQNDVQGVLYREAFEEFAKKVKLPNYTITAGIAKDVLKSQGLLNSNDEVYNNDIFNISDSLIKEESHDNHKFYLCENITKVVEDMYEVITLGQHDADIS